MGEHVLNQPVVGIAADSQTGGYWEVASDGGIFAFDAPFFGSTGNIILNRPILSMASIPSGAGYWFVASDGGIFAFGGAKFLGSLGSSQLTTSIVGMADDAGLPVATGWSVETAASTPSGLRPMDRTDRKG